MTTPDLLLARVVLATGPPRSGTTVTARALGWHPRVLLAADDNVLEPHALYNYRARSGVVADLRDSRITPSGAKAALRDRLFDAGHLAAATPVALGALPADTLLALKSPEASFVLPALAAALPGTRFVVIHRGAAAPAASMLRKGAKVRRVKVFAARWRTELDEAGRAIPPPGIPDAWHVLWRDGGDAVRCVLSAAAYLTALADGIPKLPTERTFVLDHRRLIADPHGVFAALARFLGIDAAGFARGVAEIAPRVEPVPEQVLATRDELAPLIGLAAAEEFLAAAAARSREAWGR
jgi:hypothetical protein